VGLAKERASKVAVGARVGLCAVALSFLGSVAACNFDAAAPGVRGQCATAVGDPLCEEEAIESASDAWWKLVQCGSIPVANPADENFFDYGNCIARFESLSEHRSALSMACIEASTCDQLRFENGPDRPRNSSESMPPCLEYGDPQ